MYFWEFERMHWTLNLESINKSSTSDPHVGLIVSINPNKQYNRSYLWSISVSWFDFTTRLQITEFVLRCNVLLNNKEELGILLFTGRLYSQRSSRKASEREYLNTPDWYLRVRCQIWDRKSDNRGENAVRSLLSACFSQEWTCCLLDLLGIPTVRIAEK
jgi:hypothetical protein